MGWQDAPIIEAAQQGGWRDAPLVEEEPQGVSAEEAAIFAADPFGAMQIPSGDLPKEVRALGGALGLEKAVDPFARAAARGVTALEDTAPRATPEELEVAIPEPSGAELAGGGLQIGALLIPYGKLAGALKTGFGKLAPEAVAKALSEVGVGATGGFAFEAGEKLQAGEAPTPGATTAVGAALPLGLKLTAKAIQGLNPREFAERLFQSASKVGTTLKPEKRSRIINAALDEGIVPTKAGLAKTQRLITKYTNQVDDVIDAGKATREGTISTDDILKRLDDVREDFEASILSDTSLIDDLADSFRAKFGDRLTVQRAQEAKRALHRDLKKAFGERKGIEIEGAKNIARGIREELETVFPEIASLNQKSKALIELNKELERAVGRISNRNIFGLTTKIFTAAGVSKEAPGIALLIALSESILGNPRVKSRLAIVLSKAGAGKSLKEITKTLGANLPRLPGDIALSGAIKSGAALRRGLSR